MSDDPAWIADVFGDGASTDPDRFPRSRGPFVTWVRSPLGSVVLAFAAVITWFCLGQCLPGAAIGIFAAAQADGEVDAAELTATTMQYLPLILFSGLVVVVAMLVALRKAGWLADDPSPAFSTRKGLRTGAWIAAAFAVCILGATSGRSWRLLAYFVSAVLFAAIHMHLPATPNYIWMALCFTFVYERTGTVWSAVAVHALNNLWGVYALTSGS